MIDDNLDTLLASSLREMPRPPDKDFVDHNRKRVAVRALLARETQAAVRRGMRDFCISTALIIMLLVWIVLIGGGVGIAGIALPLLVIGFWALDHDWSFPDLSFQNQLSRNTVTCSRESEG